MVFIYSKKIRLDKTIHMIGMYKILFSLIFTLFINKLLFMTLSMYIWGIIHPETSVKIFYLHLMILSWIYFFPTLQLSIDKNLVNIIMVINGTTQPQQFYEPHFVKRINLFTHEVSVFILSLYCSTRKRSQAPNSCHSLTLLRKLSRLGLLRW